jgi:hypothetical protein
MTDMTLSRTTPHSWMAVLLLVVVAMAACGPRTKQQRQAHGEKRTDEATLLLNDAEQDLRSLDVDRAEPKLAKAKEVLSHPDVDLSPEGEMLRSQLAELQALVPRAREERVKREREAREQRERQQLEAAVEKQRDSVVEAMSALTEVLDALESQDADSARVEAVSAAVKRVRERLASGKELEAKSEDYAASAKRTERRLEEAEAKLQQAQRVSGFISGPVADKLEAVALAKKAVRERDLDARLSLYTDARERLQRCGEGSEKLLAEAPELARRTFAVQGRPTTIRAVATGCVKQAVALKRVVVKLEKARVKRDKARAKLEKAREAREKAREKARERLEKAKKARAYKRG